jgi:acyl-CoA synthetase (AMP-forming)/AMP-acid ligase II
MVPLLEKLNQYGEGGNKVPIRGSDVQSLLAGYGSLLDLIPDIESNAIVDASSERVALSHSCLKSFLSSDFNLHRFGIKCGSRVAVLLPNGPELVLCIIGLVGGYCAAPINPTITTAEIKSELESTRCVAAILLADDAKSKMAAQAAQELSLTILKLIPSTTLTGVFSLDIVVSRSSPNGVITSPAATNHAQPVFNRSTDTVLLLHTSGTSGTKKLVRYTLDMLVVGVGCIVSSWNLQSSDVCLNMMPLFHIGGIVRNVFSPILSGGCVVACSAFDPVLFWDMLEATHFTWYYAAPTMHHAVLQEASRRQITSSLPVDSVRFVANAAGGLLPVLAESLQKTFKATILTSYGMTEW